jgi:thioredoxin-disulfide reductase
MYDLIIIGAGPAGMTAGIYAARRAMKALIIGSEVGGQMVWASEIENYPGFSKISSFDLIENMRSQTVAAGAEMKVEEVKKIERQDNGNFLVYTSRESFETQAVLVAMGLSPRRLAVSGEIEFNGKGVSYCANCDGPFFKNKVVTVVGGGNSALDAAEMMSKIASRVYLIHRNENFKAFETLLDEVKNRPNIEILLNSEIKEISGNGKVEKLQVLNIKDESIREIKTDGVFIEVGRIASTDLVADFVERNEKNQIVVNGKGETKTPGLYAAGDVTNCEIKQITVAVGQATVVTLSAYQYLQLKGNTHFVKKNY